MYGRFVFLETLWLQFNGKFLDSYHLLLQHERVYLENKKDSQICVGRTTWTEVYIVVSFCLCLIYVHPFSVSIGLINIIWGRCNLKRSQRTVIFLPVYKISSLNITLPKTLQLNTLDFLQQTITMNENAQWQMIKDSVLFALSSGFSVSILFEKKSTRGVLLCISSFFLVASITLFATRVLFILEIV